MPSELSITTAWSAWPYRLAQGAEIQIIAYWWPLLGTRNYAMIRAERADHHSDVHRVQVGFGFAYDRLAITRSPLRGRSPLPGAALGYSRRPLPAREEALRPAPA